jgi:adenine phosphoribosyltransferase
MSQSVDTNYINLKAMIREFPDFPQKGVLFRDISPLLKSREAMHYIVERFYDHFKDEDITLLAGIESRGFIIASLLASRFNKGMVMIRKQGKLPGKTRRMEYTIEYGKAVMEIQEDIISSNDRVLIADDLIATGGTAIAAAKLIESLGAKVVGFAFIVELARLKGRELLKGYNVCSLVVYDE